MQNIFSGLKMVSGETKVEVLSSSFSLSLSGHFKLTKGNFSQEYSYWGNVYNKKYQGYFDVEDYDWDLQQTHLGELPIDNISSLKTTLVNGGLKTLADSLLFTDDEIRNGFHQAIESNEFIQTCYGKGSKFWGTTPRDEKQIVMADFVLNNFDTCGDYAKKELKIEGIEGAPTYEQIRQYRESFS